MLVQKGETKLPGSLVTDLCANQSKQSRSSRVHEGRKDMVPSGSKTLFVPASPRAFRLTVADGSSQIPYPSQVRPLTTHRRQAGRCSSHLIFRILHVRQPVLTFIFRIGLQIGVRALGDREVMKNEEWKWAGEESFRLPKVSYKVFIRACYEF